MKLRKRTVTCQQASYRRLLTHTISRSETSQCLLSGNSLIHRTVHGRTRLCDSSRSDRPATAMTGATRNLHQPMNQSGQREAAAWTRGLQTTASVESSAYSVCCGRRMFDLNARMRSSLRRAAVIGCGFIRHQVDVSRREGLVMSANCTANASTACPGGWRPCIPRQPMARHAA